MQHLGSSVKRRAIKQGISAQNIQKQLLVEDLSIGHQLTMLGEFPTMDYELSGMKSGGHSSNLLGDIKGALERAQTDLVAQVK